MFSFYVYIYINGKLQNVGDDANEICDGRFADAVVEGHVMGTGTDLRWFRLCLIYLFIVLFFLFY